MTGLEALVLGIVQGLTEFLPVSSSGHLVLLQTMFGLSGSQVAFDAMLHGATLLAILAFFRRRLVEIVRRRQAAYVGKLAAGTLPIAAVGLLFGPGIERAFGDPWLVVGCLGVTGAALLSLYRKPAGPGAAAPGWAVAILIGLAQTVAVLPGISRSGSTIVAALWLGVAPAAAAEFSFLLGIPAIAGAVVLQVPALRESGGGHWAAYAIGAAAAFAAGLVAIAAVFRFLARGELRRFGFYCWAVALAFGAWLAWIR